MTHLNLGIDAVGPRQKCNTPGPNDREPMKRCTRCGMLLFSGWPGDLCQECMEDDEK